MVREVVRAGCYLLSHGKRHDVYCNPANGRRAPVPRHTEIKESRCSLIRKQLGIGE